MYQTKEIAQDIRKAARRRRVLLVLTPLLFVGLSVAAYYMIEPKYESSTSILIEKEETLNPLVMYEMAVSMATDDRLQSFNEIIYSRSTMEIMIDSLELASDIRNEAEKQALISSLRNRITTTSRASDSFEITFVDVDPERAKKGVELLSNHFISNRLRLETRRNEETVEFFSAKLEELGEIVAEQRSQVTSGATSRMQESPINVEALQSRLQNLDTRIESLDWQIFEQEQKLATVREYQEVADEPESVQILYRLSLEETPFGPELSTLLSEYDELRQQFTESYPRIQVLSRQIREVANRIPSALESRLANMERQKNDLSSQRGQVINDMERSYVATQRSNTQQSDFSIYEGLYNEMRVKLEQARMNKELGDRAASQFVVLDAPFIPERPSSPNRTLLLAMGLVLGLVVGVMLSAVAEVMDTTIREEDDLQYEKPIIAYLTNG